MSKYAVYGAPIAQLASALEKTPTPITFRKLLTHGRAGVPTAQDELHRSAQYTMRELPVRLARRVRQFYSLPFLIGSNPWIQRVARLYASSFAQLANVAEKGSQMSNDQFAATLQRLVDDHAENVPTLARGFMECHEYIDADNTTRFLNAALHSRIGIRIIAEQHLALTASAAEKKHTDAQPTRYQQTPTSVGIIETCMRPADVVRQSAEYVRHVCEATFDMAPDLVVEGDVDVATVGIPVHLDYVMTELLKNSFRATAEAYLARGRVGPIPPIAVTLSSSESQLCIRIRDEGGGIARENFPQIFSYAFTTAMEDGCETPGGANSASMDPMDPAGDAMQSSMGTLAGLGYGLPLSRLYLAYFGNSDLDIVSLPGHATSEACVNFLVALALLETLAVVLCTLEQDDAEKREG
ncbi:hypothetical protein MSPP1_000418 [Malassezia sp. CBS 17886]|nr:hypothetical protein MSPP1_000418 [Malassezia sp. CBS 17886]